MDKDLPGTGYAGNLYGYDEGREAFRKNMVKYHHIGDVPAETKGNHDKGGDATEAATPSPKRLRRKAANKIKRALLVSPKEMVQKVRYWINDVVAKTKLGKEFWSKTGKPVRLATANGEVEVDDCVRIHFQELGEDAEAFLLDSTHLMFSPLGQGVWSTDTRSTGRQG